jgi:hypothetical protein
MEYKDLHAIYVHDGKPFLFVDTVFFGTETNQEDVIIECEEKFSANELFGGKL